MDAPEVSANPSTSGPAEHSDAEIELFRPARTKCLFCKPKITRSCSVSYHRFPRLPEMSDIWARKSGFKHVLKASPRNRYKSFRVCSLHFKDSDYADRIRGRLYPFAVPSRIENNMEVPARTEQNININISEIKKTLKESLSITPTTGAENNNRSDHESSNISEDAAIRGNVESSKSISVPPNTRKQSSSVKSDLVVDLTFEAECNNRSEVVTENAESPKTTAPTLNTTKQPSAVNRDLFIDLTVEDESNDISENSVSWKAQSPKTMSMPLNTRKQSPAVNPDLFVDLTVEADSNNISEKAVSRNAESPKTISMPVNTRKQSSAVNPHLFVDLTIETDSKNISANAVSGNAQSPMSTPKTVSIPLNTREQSSAVNPELFVDLTIEADSKNISANAVSGNSQSPMPMPMSKTVSMPLNTREQSPAINPDLFVDLTFEAESNNISDNVSESTVSPNTLSMPSSKLTGSNQPLAVNHELLILTFAAENNNISRAENNTIINAENNGIIRDGSNNINEDSISGNNEVPKTISAPLSTSKPNRRKQSFAVTRDSLDPLIIKEKKIPQLKIVLFKKKGQKKKIKSKKNKSN